MHSIFYGFLKNNGQILADTLYFDLIEVQDSTRMADLAGGYDSAALKMFYLSIYHPSEPVRVNPLTPPYILTSPTSSDDVMLHYGGNGMDQVIWKEPLDGTLKVMTEPTEEMKTFKEYLEAVKLLDSVRRHYTLKGEFFELNSGGGMTFTSAFVRERLDFVQKYEKDPSFENKVNTASSLWHIYNAQHDLVFNAASQRKSAIHFNRLPFYEFGWYFLRLNEEH